MAGIAQWGDGPPLSEDTLFTLREFAFGEEPPAEFLTAFRNALSTYHLIRDNPPPSREKILANLEELQAHTEALRGLLDDTFVKGSLGAGAIFPSSQAELQKSLKALERAADLARRELPGGQGGSPPKVSRTLLGAWVAEALDSHFLYRPTEKIEGTFRYCFQAACEEGGEDFPSEDSTIRRVLRQALRAAALKEDWGPPAKDKEPEEDPRLGDYCPLRPPQNTPPSET